eukprot:TRINITY_DN1819_c0_g2_i1.p3 TRINITY_DN1819_c0_g2~~TRINITY_DN1819_c0_g2_i1.p3  ORF type:complete len:169 (-),score=35.02 TRINITY_DN1819_c0_g2_i1:39-545(-)
MVSRTRKRPVARRMRDIWVPMLTPEMEKSPRMFQKFGPTGMVRLERAVARVRRRGKRRRLVMVGLYIKMHITYEDEGKEWNLVKKSREVVCLPQTAENIFVMFQVARAPKVYAPIKKWDRKKKDWVVPEQIHEFYYSRPPCRRFIITGSLYFEKISEVQAEDHSPVDD